MLIYRSLTELMGGIGVVFLILAFFQSKKSMAKLGNTLGFDKLGGSLKKTFFSVFAIYTVIIAVFTAIFYLIGYKDILNTGTFVIDTLPAKSAAIPAVPLLDARDSADFADAFWFGELCF